MPLIIGRERFVPGFEDQLVGLREGDEKTFSLTFPEDYPDADIANKSIDFEVGMLRAAREAHARSGRRVRAIARARTRISPRCATRSRQRLERNALDRARHVFADRIIEFAVANATLELPDLLIEREQEVMLDELKVRLAEQGIGYDDYLRATERDEAKIVEEFKPDAERRVKTLLVLSEIADKERRRDHRRGAGGRPGALPPALRRQSAPRLHTSNRRAAARTRDHCCAGPRRSRNSSIAGSGNIRSSRTCNICTTTRHGHEGHIHLNEEGSH